MSRLLGHRPSPALRVATLAATTIASSIAASNAAGQAMPAVKADRP
jgi:hypothetical protein